MKRHALLLVSISAALFTLLSGCIFPWADDVFTPFGIWKSENPDLLLYIDQDYKVPDYPNYYRGIYTLDGEAHDVFVSFAGWGNVFSVHSTSTLGTGAIHSCWTMKRYSRMGEAYTHPALPIVVA